MRNTIIIACLLAPLAACAPQQQQNPAQLKQETADATARFKSDAKAVAEGVKEGWNRNNPLDINSASKDQLLHLPGINDERADKIMRGRPWHGSHELVSRHVLSQEEYEKIEDQITAK